MRVDIPEGVSLASLQAQVKELQDQLMQVAHVLVRLNDRIKVLETKDKK